MRRRVRKRVNGVEWHGAGGRCEDVMVRLRSGWLAAVVTAIVPVGPALVYLPPVRGSGTISRRNLLSGQFFPQLLRGQLEELPETQLGEIQAQQAVRRLTLAAAYSKATQVPVQTLEVQ